MAGLSTLQDSFDDGTLDTGLWSGSYGDPDEAGGHARIPCGTGYAGLKSGSSYTLTGNGIFLRLIAPTPSGAVTAAASVLVLSATGGTDAGFIVDPAQSAVGLYLREGYADGAAVFLTYSATDHAWLRFREDAGTLYWDTSADGLTWTNRRTATTPAWAAETGLAFLVEGHRDSGTADFVEVDNVNVPPFATVDASATLAAAGTLTATGYAARAATATISATSSLTAAGARTATASSGLASLAALTAAATPRRSAASALTATGTATAVGIRRTRATAVLTATATLTARPAGVRLDTLTAGIPRTRWAAETPRT